MREDGGKLGAQSDYRRLGLSATPRAGIHNLVEEVERTRDRVLKAEKGGQTGAKSAFETLLAKLRSENSSIRADFFHLLLPYLLLRVTMHKWVLERGSREEDGRCVMAHYRLSFVLRFFADAGTVKS